MTKTSLPFNSGGYALVATRITLFYERFPTGRIVTELVSRDRDVLFKASVYRSTAEQEPAATGWASEREGDGEINEVACVENTETSAIGRALANLGFTASLKRPSREEMEKAERARSRVYRVPDRSQDVRVSEKRPRDSDPVKSHNPENRDRRLDVIALVGEAVSRGMPGSFLGEFEQRVRDNDASGEDLEHIERRARYWLLHRAGSVRKSTHVDPAADTEAVNSPHQ